MTINYNAGAKICFERLSEILIEKKIETLLDISEQQALRQKLEVSLRGVFEKKFIKKIKNELEAEVGRLLKVYNKDPLGESCLGQTSPSFVGKTSAAPNAVFDTIESYVGEESEPLEEASDKGELGGEGGTNPFVSGNKIDVILNTLIDNNLEQVMGASVGEVVTEIMGGEPFSTLNPTSTAKNPQSIKGGTEPLEGGGAQTAEQKLSSLRAKLTRQIITKFKKQLE